MQPFKSNTYPGSIEPGLFGKNKQLTMIEIFKTNVENAGQAAALLAVLNHRFPAAEINFDLEDCDRILRVKGENFCALLVIQTLANNGFECGVLE